MLSDAIFIKFYDGMKMSDSVTTSLLTTCNKPVDNLQQIVVTSCRKPCERILISACCNKLFRDANRLVATWVV